MSAGKACGFVLTGSNEFSGGMTVTSDAVWILACTSSDFETHNRFTRNHDLRLSVPFFQSPTKQAAVKLAASAPVTARS